MFHRSIHVAVLAGTIAAATTGLAVSAVNAEVPTAAVRYGDLDLNSTAGQKALARRVTLAVHSVCNEGDRMADLRCENEARGRARNDLHTARVAGY